MIKVEQNIVDTAAQLNEAFHQVKVEFFRFWAKDLIFTWHWWLVVILTVLPWVVWAVVRKKESTERLLCAGFVVLIISSYLDMVGVSMGLWGYNTAAIPTIPSYAPWNFSLLPVAAMLFYQFKPRFSPFIKSVIFAGIAAFVFEPTFTWLRIYEPMHWRHIYSFPFFIIIYHIGSFFIIRKHYEPL